MANLYPEVIVRDMACGEAHCLAIGKMVMTPQLDATLYMRPMTPSALVLCVIFMVRLLVCCRACCMPGGKGTLAN